MMKRTLLTCAAVATVAASALLPTPASAQRGFGPGFAAGVLGGAIVGGALARPYYYGPGYAYGPGYYPNRYYGYGPGYAADGYYGGYDGYGGCFLQRQRFWDGYGWRVRRVRVCR